GERAFRMTKEAQHRHHTVDRVLYRLRRRDVSRCEGLAQRQQLQQNFDDRTRIAAGMPTVRKNLPVDFLLEPLGHRFDMAGLAGNTQRGIVERDYGLQPRDAPASVTGGVAQKAYLTQQASQKTPIKTRVGV